MKKTERLIAMLLAVMLMVSLVPAEIYADFETDPGLNDGSAVTDDNVNPYIEEETIRISSQASDAQPETEPVSRRRVAGRYEEEAPAAPEQQAEPAAAGDASTDAPEQQAEPAAADDATLAAPEQEPGEETPVYTLIYSSNFGDAEREDEFIVRDYTGDEQIVIAANTFVSDGQKFASWNTLAEPSEFDYGTVLYPGEVVGTDAFENGELRLFAQWDEAEEEKAEEDDSDEMIVFFNHMYYDNEDITAEKSAVLSSLIELQSQNQQTAKASNGKMLLMAAPSYTDSSAASALRNAMVKRQPSITLKVNNSAGENTDDLCRNIVYMATRHTGNPKEGDYITWQGLGITAAKSGTTLVELKFTMTYVTTLEQENAVDSAVASLMKSLSLSSKSDYEKIKAVYDWETSKISYDASTYLTHTAYAALVNKRACCQGFAQLLYRMMLECGIDARVVRGFAGGSGHAWNIVRLDGVYYCADATWDKGFAPKYAYFLDGSRHFSAEHKGNIFFGDALSEGISNSIYYTVLSTSADENAYGLSAEPYNATPYLTVSASQQDMNVGETASFSVTAYNVGDAYSIDYSLPKFVQLVGSPVVTRDGNSVTSSFTIRGTESGSADMPFMLRDSSGKGYEQYSACVKVSVGSSADLLTLSLYSEGELFRSIRFSGTVYVPMDIPAREGFMFSHWEDSKGNWYAPAEHLESKGDVDLYAVWENEAIYLTFDANGGECALSGRTVQYNSAYGELPVPEKTGYVFAGWYTARTEGEQVTESTKVARFEAHTLYAHWASEIISVSFDANGGTADSDSLTVAFGSPYGTLPAATLTGYAFSGWFTAPSGGTAVTETSLVGIPEGHILYAHWTANNYSVVFDANGGTGTMNPQTLTYDTSAALSANAFRMERGIFLGWSTDPAAAAADYADRQSVLNLVSEGSVTLYAVWMKLVGLKVVPEAASGLRIRYVDESGGTVDYDTGNYAVFAEKGTALNFRISSYQLSEAGDEFGITSKSAVKYTTSNKSAASVTANSDGSATVEIPKTASGTCTITAVTTDSNKLSGSIVVSVMDRAPKLGAAKVTLDTQKLNSASVSLTNGYENNITSVEFREYNSASKTYAPSDKVSAVYDAGSGLVTIEAFGVLKNQTIKGQLVVDTVDNEGCAGEYTPALSITVKNSVPSVTVKQPAKLNLFFDDDTALLNVTVKNESVRSLALVSSSFTGVDNGDGSMTVSRTDPTDAKPAAAATLIIELEGYRYPVTKSIKITTVTTKPTAKLGSTTLKMNSARPNATVETTLKLSSSSMSIEGVTASDARFEIAFNDGALTAKLLDSAIKNGSYSVKITPYVRGKALNPVTLKLTVKNSPPKATVSAAGKVSIAAGTGITYTLTKLTDALGNVTGCALAGANADMFDLVQIEPNAKGQPRFLLTLKPGAPCTAGKTYKVQLQILLDSGDVAATSALSVKPTK